MKDTDRSIDRRTMLKATTGAVVAVAGPPVTAASATHVPFNSGDCVRPAGDGSYTSIYSECGGNGSEWTVKNYFAEGIVDKLCFGPSACWVYCEWESDALGDGWVHVDDLVACEELD